MTSNFEKRTLKYPRDAGDLNNIRPIAKLLKDERLPLIYTAWKRENTPQVRVSNFYTGSGRRRN